MNELQQIEKFINDSKTGCIAQITDVKLEVLVPGIQSLSGGKTRAFYNVEQIYTMQGAKRLVNSMI